MLVDFGGGTDHLFEEFSIIALKSKLKAFGLGGAILV